MAANRTNSLPNEEAISSSVRRVYRTMTEEVPCERSRVSGGNSSNAGEELPRNFQIPRLGAQQPPLYNPRVNYGSNGSSGKKGKKRHLPGKESQRKKVHMVSLVKNWCCCQLLMLMKFHALTKNESFRKWA